MKTGLKKSEKTTDIWFDEKDPIIYIRTHNTDLKKRLAAYTRQHPTHCKQTDADPETGCMEFEIAKGRFSFRLTAPYSEERHMPPQPKSPGIAELLFKYLDVQKEKGKKYSLYWQQQHTADELKAVAKAVNILEQKGIFNLDGLDAALSSVDQKTDEISDGLKAREKRMKQLKNLIENAQAYQRNKPFHDAYKQIKWKSKQEDYAEAHRAELTIWNAANRFLHANLPEGVKSLPIAKWEKELAALNAENKDEYEKLKESRAEVAELQKIRRYVDVALKAETQQQTQIKRHEHDL